MHYRVSLCPFRKVSPCWCRYLRMMQLVNWITSSSVVIFTITTLALEIQYSQYLHHHHFGTDSSFGTDHIHNIFTGVALTIALALIIFIIFSLSPKWDNKYLRIFTLSTFLLPDIFIIFSPSPCYQYHSNIHIFSHTKISSTEIVIVLSSSLI
jgi:hypothetical protein